MKQFFTYTFYAKKTLRFLLLLLILLVAMPIVETQHAEAQTTKTGNFFTRRFQRKNKFQKKSKTSTAFQRKPFSCEDIGKTKVAQVKVSKKQLRRWEEERLVKAQQEEARQQRLAKNKTENKTENKEEKNTLSASSKNDLEEIANQKNTTIKKNSETKNSETKKEDTKTEEKDTKRAGWYSSDKPDAPKISPIVVNQKNEITNQKNKQELEIAAKHSRLGYTIILESNNEKQLQAVKKYLISIGTEEESIKIKPSENQKENEIVIQIEK